MLRIHYNLKAMFIVVTLVAIALFIFRQIQPETWSSQLQDNEISSATVEFVFFNDETVEHRLEKAEAIKFIRLLETCPVGLRETGMAGCALPATPIMISVEFELVNKNTLLMQKLGQHLLIDTGADDAAFVFIGFEVDEFFHTPTRSKAG